MQALDKDELDPINLFNITWKDAANQVRKLVLPPALTGIDANVVVMLGLRISLRLAQGWSGVQHADGRPR